MTGISDEAEVSRYPFRPDEIISGVDKLVSVEPVESDEI